MLKPTKIDPTAIAVSPLEAARRLGVTLRTLERRIGSGDFPLPRKIGRSVRFLVSEIESWTKTLPVHELSWRGLGGLSGEEPAPCHPPTAEEIEEQEERSRQTRGRLDAHKALRLEDERIAEQSVRRIVRGPRDPLPLP